MFYEDYQIKNGDSVPALGTAYGYKADEWKKIWESPKNAQVAATRGAPDRIQSGDQIFIPIPWHVASKNIRNMGDGAGIELERDGELGTQLSWVQTVYQGNQPVPNTDPYCVDGCPADDDLPFYWTNAELAKNPNLRKKFSDHSARRPPTAAQGTTKWRGLVSLAVVTEKRVTVWNSLVWGWDMEPSGSVTLVGPRDATTLEVNSHLDLLRRGIGTGPLPFGKAGWTFRGAPP
jgi:hypothetical protein